MAAGAGAGQLFWSSDSRSIGFAQTDAGFQLATIDLAAGTRTSVGSVRIDQVGAWDSRGGILAKIGGTIAVVPLDGGPPTAATTLDASRGETSHLFPSFLPDGRHFLYVAASTRSGFDGMVYVTERAGREPVPLFASDSQVVYAAPGHLLYMLGNTLLARPFDAERRRVTGAPVAIAEQVERHTGSRRGAFSVSRTKRVLACRRPREARLVWFDRDGGRLGQVCGTPGSYRNPALSPDGSRLAILSFDAGTGSWDVWLMEVATGRMSRLTLDDATDDGPVWSRDGEPDQG